MPVGFSNPVWLFLIVAAVPMGVLAARWFLSMSFARRWTSIATRTLLFCAIAALLAGAVSMRETNRLAVVAVVDVSASFRQFGDASEGIDGYRAADAIGAVREMLLASVGQRGPEDLLGIVVFDGSALAVAIPTRGDPLQRSIDLSMQEGTDIGAALRYAAAMIPPDASGRIVLFSDGNQTRGDAIGSASELVSRLGSAEGERSALPIDVVPFVYEIDREVVVETVDAPPVAEAEAMISVRVALRSQGRAEGVLRLLQGGQEIDISPDTPGLGRALRLAPGRRVEVIETKLKPGRVHRFDAVWEPRVIERGADSAFSGDTRTENNRASGLSVSPGEGEVLLVDGVGSGAPTGGAALLANTLRRAGIAVTQINPAAVPTSMVEMQAYDLVILQDVPADSISVQAQQVLASHVQDLGAGLVMVGGYNSFGAGGWRGSTLEPLLPVDLEIPDELIVPKTAVIIVLDSSGSMGGSLMGTVRTQQEIANEAAAAAVGTLDARDLVGVIEFDSQRREVVALAPNTDPDATAQAIRGISSGGGTVIGPALELARDRLSNVDAEVKHVVLLSDGQSRDAERLPGIASDMARQGMKITTIGVGSGEHQATLDAVASATGGTHYEVLNPSTLPRLFIRVIRLVRTPLVREVPFMPRVVATGSPLVEGLDGMPVLTGLSLTRPRTDPTVTTSMVTDQGEPVFATWQVGLGQVAAFTSDARGDNWASVWADWAGYSEFWTRLARTVSRPTAAGPYDLRLVRNGDGLTIRLDASDESGAPINYLSVPTTIYDDDGTPSEVSLSQVAPGLYEAQIERPGAGQVVAVVRPRRGDEPLPPIVGGTTMPAGAEFRRLRSDADLLERIAETSGGRVLPVNLAEDWALFDRSGVPPRITTSPMFLPLMTLVLLLFWLDVATRRIAWDRFVSREFGVDIRRAATEATRDRGAQAGRTLAGLQAGRQTDEQSLSEDASSSLGDRSARTVIADARARREREEAERLRKIREEMLGTTETTGQTPPAQATTPVRDGQDPEQPGTGGLLAAKRRARERFEQEEDDR